MARPKKKTSTPKVKQLVKLRFKKLANGEQSIYLDIYKHGQRAYEFLKDVDGNSLRLLPETGTPDEIKAFKERNKRILLEAEALRLSREKEVVELGKVENKVTTLGKMLLKDWMEQFKVIQSTPTKSISVKNRICSVISQLKKWMGKAYETTQMQSIDIDFCRAFLRHLQSVSIQRYSKDGNEVKLSEVSIHAFFITFRYSLTIAVREGVIPFNPTDKMRDNGELPKQPKTQKVFLTRAEVFSLMKTPIYREEVKRAFLFACFTGLRISDIYRLKWGDIKQDGQTLRLQLTMKKTKTPLYMKVNEQAQKWLPEKGEAEPTDNVFSDLPSDCQVERILHKWGELARIEKRFGFHTARHTFATLSLNAGADIYTVSKLMGHRNLQTTQVYLELLDERKDLAVDRLSDIFSKGVEGV